MADRFHFDGALTHGAEIALDDVESRHLAQVLRGKPGDAVVVFDGAGVEADALVRAVTKRGVTLEIAQVRADPAANRPGLILATAVPKGDRFKWLVEKATELGVDRLVPLSTARGVVDPREAKLDRMRAAIIAACKQCGRNRLMELAPTTTWADFLNASRGAAPSMSRGALLLADPRGRSVDDALASLPADATVAALVGPEGGLTDDEISEANAAGAVAVRLGPHILRIETAGLAIASVWAARPRG